MDREKQLLDKIFKKEEPKHKRFESSVISPQKPNRNNSIFSPKKNPRKIKDLSDIEEEKVVKGKDKHNFYKILKQFAESSKKSDSDSESEYDSSYDSEDSRSEFSSSSDEYPQPKKNKH